MKALTDGGSLVVHLHKLLNTNTIPIMHFSILQIISYHEQTHSDSMLWSLSPLNLSIPT